MRPIRPDAPDETRAEIARRRLAQLAASFDATLPPAEPPVPEAAPRRLETAHVKVLATLAVVGGVLLVWWLLSGRPQTTEPGTSPPFSAAPSASMSPGASSGAPAQDLVIDVVGKVRRPGIVTLPPGARVHEAIEAAGGLKGKVDTTALNMARVLVDGEQILVGIEPVAIPGVAAGGGAPSGKVNLNTATPEQLDTLPGVGPVTAAAILAWRTANGRFTAVEDLLDVKGIGEATLAELRDLVVV